MSPSDLKNSQLYINRELSLIEFNKRVIEEAADISNPLLERLKFAAIFSSNTDEFFMIRVAGLKNQVDVGADNSMSDGMTPAEQLAQIRARLLPLVDQQMALLRNDILPAMERVGVVISPYESLGNEDKDYLSDYFRKKIFPLLTPLGIDSGHPFPQILNRSLNICFVIADSADSPNEKRVAVMQLPTNVSRFIRLPHSPDYHFVLLEEVVEANSGFLFPGLAVTESSAFRVSRDADIEIAEDEASDLLAEMEEQVRKRRWGAAVRLETDHRMSLSMQSYLLDLLDLEKEDLYSINGPLNVTDFMELTKLDIRHCKFPAFTTRPLPKFLSEQNVFAAIRQSDHLVHHPFDSFSQNVVRFLVQAAHDPEVLSIKITLYRAGGQSTVVQSLIEAAQKGKSVVAFIELKARFDEENNILWAKELERAGVHVIYGIPGLKTHCKIAIVTRKEGDAIRTYCHISTGNYNNVTARLYTDVALFTAREEYSRDALQLFNYLTGYSRFRNWESFAVAPIDLSETILGLIDRETELHTDDNPGHIMVKMNALSDGGIIRALYRASQKGVKVQLIIRGICCLRPGIPGISENIEVRSVLGRFLEHSRVAWFKNNGSPRVFLTSADWRPRNLFRRVEIMWPILDPALTLQLKRILDIYWQDNTKARLLHADGTYTRIIPQPGEEPFVAQDYFLSELDSEKPATAKVNFALNN